MKFYCVTHIFDIHIFDNETTAFLKFFEICGEMYFVSLFFLNERNITTSLLMIQLKCTVVHYANLNSSPMNEPFLNYGPLNTLLRFFSASHLCLFQRSFCRKLQKNLLFFSINIHKFISRCSILQNIKMSSLVILKWRHFEYKIKFEKGPKQAFLTYSFKDCAKKVFEDLEINSY